MRYLLIVVLVLTLCIDSMAEQITLNLDRCVVLNNLDRQDGISKVAIHFPLPQELQDKDIVFAELSIPLPAMRLNADSLMHISFFPFTADWSLENIGYEYSDSITDSMSVCTNTIQLGNSNQLKFDITIFIKQINDHEKSNYGLIGLAQLLGDNSLQLPDNVGNLLLRNAWINVVY